MGFDSRIWKFVQPLQMETFGIPPLAKSDDWQEDLLDRSEKRFKKALEDETVLLNREAVEEFIRRQVRRYLTSQLVKKPVVITRIHVV